MLAVEELKTSSQLPKEFLDTLPSRCEACGQLTEITESLTMLRCSNLFCIEKSVQRMVAMLKDIGVKNMGESKCRAFLEHFNSTNPYIIFMYEPDEDGPLYEGASMDFSYAIFDQIDQRRNMLLWEYVKIGNLPGIRDSARKLFANYDSLDEFYDDLEHGGVDFVQEQLSIKGKTSNVLEEDGVSVRAVDIYNTLVLFKEDLFFAYDPRYVDIKRLDTRVINICISTAVGRPYASKQDFVSQMNNQFGHKVHLNFLSSVTNDCEFLIWSKEGATTNKVKRANTINEKRRLKNIESGVSEDKGLIRIMTGEEFRGYLEQL